MPKHNSTASTNDTCVQSGKSPKLDANCGLRVDKVGCYVIATPPVLQCGLYSVKRDRYMWAADSDSKKQVMHMCRTVVFDCLAGERGAFYYKGWHSDPQ